MIDGPSARRPHARGTTPAPRSRLLRPPVLRAGSGEEHRAASWLELYFDLIFVVAIAQLALGLAEDPSLRGFGQLVLLFMPIWWAWVGFTLYSDRFDSDDVGFRGLMLAGMATVAGLAVAVPSAFDDGATAFAVAYSLNRLVLISMYLRVRHHLPAVRPLVRVSTGAYAAGTVMWLSSLALTEPWRSLVWVSAILLEASVPWLFRRTMTAVPTHASHLPERFGLFTIIVLGESMVAVVLGLDGATWDLATALTALAGFVVASLLWWLYFDVFDRVRLLPGLVSRNTFIYGHLPITLGLTVCGVGIKKTILGSETSELGDAAAWALSGGAALMLFGVTVTAHVSIPSGSEHALVARLTAALALVVVAALHPSLSAPRFSLLVAAVLAALAGLETLRRPQPPPGGPSPSYELAQPSGPPLPAVDRKGRAPNPPGSTRMDGLTTQPRS